MIGGFIALGIVLVVGIGIVVGRVVVAHHQAESFWQEWRPERASEELMSQLHEFFDCSGCD